MKHKLLARQLKLLSLDSTQLPTDLNQWQELLDRVSKSYEDHDQDRYLLERSLQISSKEMQERFQALDLEKAKSLQATKLATLGEMAGSIAHEINNPIGLINILTSQLIEAIQEDEQLDKAMLISSLKQIEEGTWRIAKIIKGLRGFSRDGSGDLFVATPVNKIIDDVLVFCSERFKQHNIHFKVSELNNQLTVECREVEICQVLLNLLNNAFDAIQNCEDKWIEIEILENANHIQFYVKDCGKGISPQVLEKIFQPFYTTKEVGKGTGLGLSISKKIAENHGGSLVYDSSCPNTCFIFTIAKVQKLAKAS